VKQSVLVVDFVPRLHRVIIIPVYIIECGRVVTCSPSVEELYQM
jgi:hypothetical protein